MEHIAVTIARATLDLAKANEEAAQTALADAKTAEEIAVALAWVAAAQWALNTAEVAHDGALQDLHDCQNPCPCGCEVKGCNTCEEHASGGSSCSSGSNSSGNNSGG